MNENNEINSGNVMPYKASGNLNTAIANPSININDAMDVNIQNMATNSIQAGNTPNNTVMPNTANVVVNNPTVAPNMQNTNNNIQVIQNNNNQKINNNINSNNQSENNVKRTYVTADNKSKKKNISLNMGPEFKIGLLIVVILLVFVFLLPMLSELIMGY